MNDLEAAHSKIEQLEDILRKIVRCCNDENDLNLEPILQEINLVLE